MSQSETDQKRGFRQALAALRNRNYRWYWFSGLGQTGAQGVQQLTMAWLVLDLTGSTGQLGLVIFMQGMPMAAMSLFGGVLADRYDRKKLLTLSQVFTFANLVTLATLTATGLVEVWHLYIYAMGLGVMQAITMPARNALIRSLVGPDDMQNAVALNAMQMQASRIVWPAIAGVLIGVVGIGSTLAVSATLSMIGIACLLVVRPVLTAEPPRKRTSALSEIAEGGRYTFSHPLVGQVMTLALLLAIFGLAFMQLGVGFARQELDFSSNQAGLFLMAGGIGSIIGSVSLLATRPKSTLGLVVAICLFFAFSILALALNPLTLLAFVFIGCFGFSTSTMSTVSQTIFQIHVPQRLLGRVISFWSLGGGLASVTALPIGFAGDEFGLRWALGSVAVMMVGFTIIIGAGFRPLAWLGGKQIEDETELAPVTAGAPEGDLPAAPTTG